MTTVAPHPAHPTKARQRPATTVRRRSGALAVLQNRPFLLLWLSQAVTQIGGNMVLYGLTVIVLERRSRTPPSALLILTFLVPAVIFSAVAGVYVDRLDRRIDPRGHQRPAGVAFAAIFARRSEQLALLYLLNIVVSTVSTFFGPAEAAMIPRLVPRQQLLAANGLFTFTLNAAFALGLRAARAARGDDRRPEALILIVAALYLVAAAFCATLPRRRRCRRDGGRAPGGRAATPSKPSARCSASCARASATSASIGPSAGR